MKRSCLLLQNSVPDQQLMGRVSVKEEASAVCNIDTLSSVLDKLPDSRVVFCIGSFSMKEVCSLLQTFNQKNCRFLFHISGTHSVVGSDTIFPVSNTARLFAAYSITHGYQKRMKRLVDIKISVFFLLTFPFHFLLHPQAFQLIKNSFQVLIGKQSWVGYATNGEGLPAIKKGVISSLGDQQAVSQLLRGKADRRYAMNYDWWQDLTLIFQNYKRLG